MRCKVVLLAALLLAASPSMADPSGPSYVQGFRTMPPGAAVYDADKYLDHMEHGTDVIPLGTANSTPIALAGDMTKESVSVVMDGYVPQSLQFEAGKAPPEVMLRPDSLSSWVADGFKYHGAVWVPGILAAVGLLGYGAWSLVQYGRRRAGTREIVHLTLQGRTFDGYTLVDELGQGAFSHVYRAKVEATGDMVAMKVLKSEYLDATTSEALARFHRETRVQLTHKNVVQVLGYGDYQGRPYIVLELIVGQTLRGLLKPKLPAAEALGLFMQMCRGLAFAHQKGFVHRDLKPENVMIKEDGTVKLMDFGIAKHLNTPGATRSALTMGTPRYMSPEQVDSSKTDARSDIYTMGIMLFEMLTGDTPFDGDFMELITKHMTEPPPKLRSLEPELPSELEAMIERMLEKNRDDRFPSVDALIEAAMVCCAILSVPA